MPNKTQDRLAGSHSISCKSFSHKQHGFGLRRMVTQPAGNYKSEWSVSGLGGVLEALDFEMSESAEP